MKKATATHLSFADSIATASPCLVSVLTPDRPYTGIVWDSHTIVTVNAPLKKQDEVEVGLGDGQRVNAKRVIHDRGRDLAFIEVEQDLSLPMWAKDTSKIRVGDFGAIVCRPGLSVRATLVMVGEVEGEWDTDAGAPIDRFLGLDCSLPESNAGGALVGHDGLVLGIYSPTLVRSGTVIPAETVRNAIESTRAMRNEKGKIFLGMGLEAAALNAEQRHIGRIHNGLSVSAVNPASAAGKAGVLKGDIVLALNGKGAQNVGDLRHAFAVRGRGEATQLQVLRGEDRIDLTLGGRSRKSPATQWQERG